MQLSHNPSLSLPSTTQHASLPNSYSFSMPTINSSQQSIPLPIPSNHQTINEVPRISALSTTSVSEGLTHTRELIQPQSVSNHTQIEENSTQVDNLSKTEATLSRARSRIRPRSSSTTETSTTVPAKKRHEVAASDFSQNPRQLRRRSELISRPDSRLTADAAGIISSLGLGPVSDPTLIAPHVPSEPSSTPVSAHPQMALAVSTDEPDGQVSAFPVRSTSSAYPSHHRGAQASHRSFSRLSLPPGAAAPFRPLDTSPSPSFVFSEDDASPIQIMTPAETSEGSEEFPFRKDRERVGPNKLRRLSKRNSIARATPSPARTESATEGREKSGSRLSFTLMSAKRAVTISGSQKKGTGTWSWRNGRAVDSISANGHDDIAGYGMS